MIFLRIFIFVIFVKSIFAKFDAPLPTKENVGEYLIEQFAKNGGVIPEKYDGPVYDDMNVVIDNNVDEQQPFSVINDTTFEDEPKLFTFDPEEAPIFRGKRQSGFQPSAPVRSASTGAAIVARVDSTSDIVPYDAHVDPDFPAEAPVARGLKNVPEGWNMDKEIDYEFQQGYRKGSNGINPSYSGQHSHSSGGSGMESGGNNGGMMQGPYIDSGASQSMGGGSNGGYSGMGSTGYGGMNNGYGSMGSSGYSGIGSSGYGSMGSSGYGYGSNYGGMSNGYSGLGNSYGGMNNGGYGGLGNGYGSGSSLGYSGYGNPGGYGGLGGGGLGQGYGGSYGGLGQGFGGYGGGLG